MLTEKEQLTIKYKKMIQATMKEHLGHNISMESAWNLYKALHIDTIGFVNTLPKNSKGIRKVSIAGFCTYEIIESEPSPSMKNVGMTKNYKFRVRQSSTLSKYLNQLNGELLE